MLSVMSQPDSSMNFLNFVLNQCGERLYVASPVVLARQVADCNFALGR